MDVEYSENGLAKPNSTVDLMSAIRFRDLVTAKFCNIQNLNLIGATFLRFELVGSTVGVPLKRMALRCRFIRGGFLG